MVPSPFVMLVFTHLMWYVVGDWSILEKVVQINDMFLPPYEVHGGKLVFFSKVVLLCLTCFLFLLLIK